MQTGHLPTENRAGHCPTHGARAARVPRAHPLPHGARARARDVGALRARARTSRAPRPRDGGAALPGCARGHAQCAPRPRDGGVPTGAVLARSSQELVRSSHFVRPDKVGRLLLLCQGHLEGERRLASRGFVPKGCFRLLVLLRDVIRPGPFRSRVPTRAARAHGGGAPQAPRAPRLAGALPHAGGSLAAAELGPSAQHTHTSASPRQE